MTELPKIKHLNPFLTFHQTILLLSKKRHTQSLFQEMIGKVSEHQVLHISNLCNSGITVTLLLPLLHTCCLLSLMLF